MKIVLICISESSLKELYFKIEIIFYHSMLICYFMSIAEMLAIQNLTLEA